MTAMLLRFTLGLADGGDMQLALPVAAVAEVMHLPALSRPPGMPSLLEGYFMLAGVAVPAVRLAEVFALAPPELCLHSPLVLLRGPRPSALLVKSLLGLESPAGDRRVPLPGDGCLSGCCATMIAQAAAPAIHLLDAPRLVALIASLLAPSQATLAGDAR